MMYNMVYVLLWAVLLGLCTGNNGGNSTTESTASSSQWERSTSQPAPTSVPVSGSGLWKSTPTQVPRDVSGNSSIANQETTTTTAQGQGHVSVAAHVTTPRSAIKTVKSEEPAPPDYCQSPMLLFDIMKNERCRGVSISCKGACGELTRMFTRDCACDALCHVYGDCCWDFTIECPHVIMTDFSGLTKKSGVCTKIYDHLGQSMMLIGQCAAGWQDQETEKKCLMDIRTKGSLVPVTDNVTMVSYRNQYCAICNSVSEQQLLLWEANVVCGDEFEPGSDQELFAGLDQHECVIQLVPPEPAKSDLRVCHSDIDTCDENYCGNNEVQQLCKGGTIFRVLYNETAYRNPFCLLCKASILELDAQCGYREFTGVDLGSYSFSLLIDFSASDCDDCDIAAIVNGTDAICDATDTLCLEAFWKSSSYSEWLGLISIVCLSVSMICMLCRIVAQAFVKIYHNLPNEMQLSLVVAMFLTAVCFLLGPSQVGRQSFCAGIGVVMHWMLLASFLWMSAIAYDMFKVFSSIISKTKDQRVKFLTIYSCYSWILSAVIVMVCFSLDLADIDSTFRPHYGRGVCWIAQRNALITFVGVPIAVVIIINALFYVRTYIYLHSALHSAKLEKCRTGGAQHPFGIYVKLFVLMGFTWVIGYVAAFSNHDIVWTLFIIFNASQGVFVSLPSLLSKQVRKQLKQKFGLLEKANTDLSTSQVYITAKRDSKLSSGSEHSIEMKTDKSKINCEKEFSSLDKQ